MNREWGNQKLACNFPQRDFKGSILVNCRYIFVETTITGILDRNRPLIFFPANPPPPTVTLARPLFVGSATLVASIDGKMNTTGFLTSAKAVK